MQRVLSEARAELDFHHFVIFGDVNIYFFSLNTQVDAHVVLNPQRLSCSCVKYGFLLSWPKDVFCVTKTQKLCLVYF